MENSNIFDGVNDSIPLPQYVVQRLRRELDAKKLALLWKLSRELTDWLGGQIISDQLSPQLKVPAEAPYDEMYDLLIRARELIDQGELYGKF